MDSSRRIVISPRSSVRLDAARVWLQRVAGESEVLVVAASWEAADDLVRELAIARAALFAVHRLTFDRLVGLLAADDMALTGAAPASLLATQAVVARAVHHLATRGELSYFAPVADRPGFAGATARTLAELRLNCIRPAELETLAGVGPPLAAIAMQYESELRDAHLADRAKLLEIATDAVLREPATRFVGIPTLLLDVPAEGSLDAALMAALAKRAPSILATLPAGDERSIASLRQALGLEPDRIELLDERAETLLLRLQKHLFGDPPDEQRDADTTVAMVSAPGEMQESIEIARRIQSEAAAGVPFDQIAIILHAPERYTPYLHEALHRAAIPAYFARGTMRPEPGGRALLALLACAAEGLSARRFAEYLSLAQVPDRDDAGAGDSNPVPADLELGAAPLSADLEIPPPPPESQPLSADPAPVIEGTLRAPWRWEQLLVDAAVIGGSERWRIRLDGLEAELTLRRGELDDDDARAAAIDRQLLDLGHLKRVASPLVMELAALPGKASWGEWLASLRHLVGLAIRDDRPVLASLAELEPMAPVGPIELDEVRMVLADRLGTLEDPPPRRRYGAVFIATARRARGMSFQVVIVPGLAEKLFPKRLADDPILPEPARLALGHNLTLSSARAAAERLALRIAVGAARDRVMLSYPRVDLELARQRVPSFYALEVLRAAEGKLPGFEELARRTSSEQSARLGWPAPADPHNAIDEAEFDLAVLDKLVDADPETTIGAAHYLLSANEHLARALRTRARRWRRRWSRADGLIEPTDAERAALERHQLTARSYSATALQNYAICPYRFFLQAILRLAPRDEVEAIETIDPLVRGALFHEVQFELLTELRGAGLLPVTPQTLPDVLERADRALHRVASRYRDKLAPAIERVWMDGIEVLAADLREWLRRCSADPGRPEHFELAFGLSDRPQADPQSRAEPAALANGLKLRGSIDLVERDRSGRLSVTDHKTGRVWAKKGTVVGGGKILQPVLYALAAERLLGEPVGSGRLYYCTAAGGFEERVVPLDEIANRSINQVIEAIGRSLREGFLPAAPDRGECDRCDYRRICGPYEERRVEMKPQTQLEPLTRIRRLA